MAKVQPSLTEIGRLSTPLNSGEWQVLQALTEHLDDDWYVFVQPHLLNHQPDFVVAAAHHGVTVIEVKDWAPGGHRGRDGFLEVRDRGGTWVRTGEDPVAQAHRYRSAITERFLTPPGDPSNFRLVRGVVALPQWTTIDATRELKTGTRLPPDDSLKIVVVGSEAFNGNRRHLDKLAYGGSISRTELRDDVFRRFLARLAEPEAVADQRRPLRLSEGARDLETNPNRATIRRAKGPAGSGKTLGLAARAARLAADRRRVLVVTFNITLAHYVQDLVRRHARQLGADHRLVDCIHIHGFCADLVSGRGRFDAQDPGEQGAEWLIREATLLYSQRVPGLPTYDAVLVDEGQDFAPSWWNFLREHVRKGTDSEMMLAADATQDIYGRESWTNEEKMSGYGFSGKWTELRGCYRLPVDLVPVVAEFADSYLTRHVDLPDIPSDHSGFAAAPTLRRWIEATGLTGSGVAAVAADAIEGLLRLEPALHQADTVYLTNDHATGMAIAAEMALRGFDVEHIFAKTESEQRRAKRRFWPGVAKLKGSTVHSFKGWEARAVVIVTGDAAGDAAELAYVALSRVKGDPANRSAFVTIVNTVPALSGFKDRFERPIGPDEVPQLGGQTGLDLG